MIHSNHASFWRNIALGVLLASTFTLFACGASTICRAAACRGSHRLLHRIRCRLRYRIRALIPRLRRTG